MPFDMFLQKIRDRFELHEWRHACAILAKDFPRELADIIDMLGRFQLKKSWLTVGGKNKSE